MQQLYHYNTLLESHFSPIIPEVKEEKPNVPTTKGELIAFAFDMGFAIALPLVLFAGGGRYIDKLNGTTPLFLIIGLLLSLVSTGIIIWRKVRNFL
jgi:F0F1-type ATP synthase assembly protein I